MLRSARERMIQTAAYEVSGMLIATPLYAVLAGGTAAASLALVVIMSLATLVWGALYNTLFDLIELRLTGRPASARPHSLRALHALSLEATDIVVSLPIIMFVGGHGLIDGIAVDIGFTLFYAVYAYVFHIVYDWLRPLTPRRAASTRNWYSAVAL